MGGWGGEGGGSGMVKSVAFQSIPSKYTAYRSIPLKDCSLKVYNASIPLKSLSLSLSL